MHCEKIASDPLAFVRPFPISWHMPLVSGLSGHPRETIMQIKAVSLLVVSLLFVVGLIGAKPQAGATGAASHPATIYSAAEKTVPTPDFFGSMLTTR